MIEQTWEDGDWSRPVTLARPCPCGCDLRDGAKGVGYLTGSDENGNGFTLWIEDEATFERMQDVILSKRADEDVLAVMGS